MKKSLLWIVVLLLSIAMVAVFSLAGCKAKAAAEEEAAPAVEEEVTPAEEEAAEEVTEEPITISLWHGFAGYESEWLNDVIKKYWAPSHPNIIVETKGEQESEALLIAMAGGNPPDLIIAPTTEVVSLWAKKGAIMDLTDFIQAKGENLDELFVKVGLEWCKYNNRYYALPFVNFNWGLLYNKDLFEAAGLDPDKPPATIDELTEYAKALTKVENGEITQLGWASMAGPGGNWRAFSFVMNFGGQFVDPITLEPTLNDPKIVEAFDYDVGLANQVGGLDKVVAFTSGFTGGDSPFTLGKAAMMIDGNWMVAFFKETKPDLNYGVAAIPASDPQYAMSSNVGTDPMVIPVGAKHADAAMEFLYFMATNPDLTAEYARLTSNIPQLKSILGNYTEDPNTKFFAELSNSKNARAWAPVPYSSEYKDEVINVLGNIYNNGVSPKEALDAGQANVKSIYDEQK